MLEVALWILFTVGFVVALRGGVLRTRGSALAGALVVLILRIVLVLQGYVFSSYQVRLVDVLVAVAALAALWAWREQYTSGGQSDGQPRPVSRANAIGAFIAVPVAAVAAVGLVAPTVPRQLDLAGCNGVPVNGAAMTARTGSQGLNARSGPGTVYPLTGRFADGCAVGVDGYCIGEAVEDSQVPLPDVRWYRLRHREDYISAAKVFALSPESALGAAPESSCPKFARVAKLARPPLTKVLDDGTLGIEAAPTGTPLVGFAVAPLPARTDSPPVEQLGQSPRRALEDTVRIVLNPQNGIRQGVKTELVAVVACLAPSAPSKEGTEVLQVDLATKKITKASASADLLERLQYAACRVDPNLSNDDLGPAAAFRSF